MNDSRQPGYGSNIEVTHEERQFILAICEEFAQRESPRSKRALPAQLPAQESADTTRQRDA